MNNQSRIIYSDKTEYFTNQNLAYSIWLNLPKNIKAAFRGKNDSRPVYGWDLV